MAVGSDVNNSQNEIISKVQSILSILDIEGVKKNRKNLNKWKSMVSDIRDTLGNMSVNFQIGFMLNLVKLIKSRSRKKPQSDVAEEQANMRTPATKEKISKKQTEKSQKRANFKKKKKKLLKNLNDAMDSEYARILRTIFKQAIANVIPKIPDMLVDEIMRAFNCDLNMEVPVVGDGLPTDIIVGVGQVDLFKQLKKVPDEGVGKYYYEASPFNLGVYPPGQSPFPVNRFLYYVIQNAGTAYPVYGASGAILFHISFDAAFDNFIISPHYKDNNSSWYSDDGASLGQSWAGNGVKFTIAEFLRDYFDNIKVIELQNILGALLEINAGLSISFGNDGKTNFADVLGINKFIGIVNKIMAACDGMDLGKISTESISHLAELVDDDSFYSFNVEEEKNFYLEAKRKSQGIIKFESCGDIEIPLDPGIFEDAADEIIATLNEGGDPFKSFEMILQTGVAGSIAKMPDPAFKELNWNWNIHFMEKLIVQFPTIFVLALLSTKIVLPIVIIAVITNNNTLLTSDPAEFARIFKRLFVRICRAILREVIKIVFKILKQYLIKLLIIYIKLLLQTQQGKRIKMILSLVQALLPFIDDLQNATTCKEILLIILKMIEATGIDVPFAPPPKFLQFAAMARRGTNAISTFEKLIVNLEEMGIPTGDMPDGSPNLFMLSQFALADAMDEEKTINGVIHAVGFPAVASGPPGAVAIPPLKIVGLPC